MRTSWETLYQQIAECTACALHQRITRRVPGQGSATARVMLIGEGPGQQEDLQGLAFVGPAGQLLTKMLAAIGLTREEVYICNVVKCRPPGNRIPTPEEAAACMPFLRQQVALVRPEIIVLLGATALKAILGEHMRITRERGQWIERKGVWMMPTYHPSALLRDESKKRDAWEDFKQIRDKLQQLDDKGSERAHAAADGTVSQQM